MTAPDREPLPAPTPPSVALVHVPRIRRRLTKVERAEVVEKVCARIASGQRLHAACTAEGIAWGTLWDWKQNDAEIAARYAHAREASGESHEDDASRIASEATPDTVHVARLQVETAKWRAATANPKKFGPKLDVTTEVTHNLGVVFLPAKVHREPISPPQARDLLDDNTD